MAMTKNGRYAPAAVAAASLFAERVRAALEADGLRVSELARRAGAPHSTLLNVIKGESAPSWPLAVAIATALGRPLDWFVTQGNRGGFADAAAADTPSASVAADASVGRKTLLGSIDLGAAGRCDLVAIFQRGA